MLGFKIEKQLYESDSTIVYRGHRIQDKKPVILKLLKPESVTDERIARFKHEFDIISKLDIHGVVKAISLEEYNGGLMMALEDIGGKSLDRTLERRPLSLTQSIKLGIILADTLGQIHKQHIIHKDIDPSNIIWNSDTGQINIIDFGLADEAPERSISPQPPSTLEGTLEYMSPEQTGRMNRPVDYRTDFYSLGVTLYQMLTGRLPFEAEDAIGLVHAHIAKAPTPPHDLDPTIPEMVSEIVMKLMAKAADDRYQSAWGLKSDLERCLRELADTGVVQHFELGLDDLSDQLHVPQKLYGREKEVAQLLEAFDLVSKGERELFLVAGYSGIGKTSLVHETHKPITERNGHFIEGKFEQLQRNVPYFAWIQAFTGFVNYILMESEENLEGWKENILEAVGDIGKVLTDVIPNLERIIGPQPDIPTLGPTEALNRFHYVFIEFIRAIATSEHPLTVFLDDLQWIDAASLSLLKTLMSSFGVSNILVIGAYRDNEVDALHPLSIAIEALRNEQARIHMMALGDLSEDTVNELIADTLRSNRSETIELTHLVYSKTKGNPFFILQTLDTLVASRAIVFDAEKRRWQWDISALSKIGITDNVVDLMIGKIQQMPVDTQDILPLAACMGFRFNLPNLEIIAKRPESVAFESLRPALREGLIILVEGGFQFAHDRIQQAAYSLIPEADKKQVHLEMGKLLLEHMREEDLFAVVDHLNAGSELLKTKDERLELAHLNLRVGSKARASAAFSAAAKYFEAGVALLGDESWQTDYDLALELYTRAAEAASLVGGFDRTDQLFDIVLRSARNPIDMVGIYQAKINILMSQGKINDAIDCGLELVDRLGIHIKPNPTVEDVKQSLRDVMATYNPQNISALINLPEMRDPDKRAAMKVIDSILGAAYGGRPYLNALLTFEQVKLIIQYGSTPDMAVTLSSYALRLCGLPFGDIDQGYDFGMLVVSLAERGDVPKLMPKLAPPVIGVVWPYKRHIRDVLKALPPYYPQAKEVGDFEFAGFNLYWYSANAIVSGRELEELEREMAAHNEEMKRIKAEVAIRRQAAFWQAAQNLLGRSACPWILDGEAYDRQETLRVIVETGNLAAQAALHVSTLLLCYLFGRYNEALEATTLAEGCRPSLIGMPIEPAWFFYDSLTRLALCHGGVSKSEKQACLERVNANQAYLELRAHHAPMNFLNNWHLVEAEKARVLGDSMSAIEHYDCAISLAHENEFIQEEALANELAGKFWLARGNDDFAYVHLHKAHQGYIRWQAWAKVKAMEAQYPQLVAQKITEYPKVKSKTLDKEAEALDLGTVMKATHTISSEIEMDKLLSEVMRIVIENAGAQNGFVLTEKDSKWVVSAQGSIDKPEVKIPQPIAIDESDVVSLGVVRYVTRTMETVVLDDAASQGEFINDPHIVQEGTKSLLCAPLLSRGRLIGILYLENNLTTHAFTPERVRLLEMLLSQSATSLENAKNYENLKESESKYRQVIDTSYEGIWMLSTDSLTTSVNNRMAEMLGYTPDEMIGRPVTDFMFEEDRHEHLEKMENRHRGISEHYERRYRHKDGREVWTLASASPKFDTKGNYAGAFAMFTDITERKQAEEALQESEKRVRRKLDAVLSPEADISELELSDIIDAEKIQKLMDKFYQLTNMGIGIIDLNGKVLVATGWQDICTKFHRVNPESCKMCIESDFELTTNVPVGTYKLYRCKNNMWDMVSPITLAGRHVGNIYFGQFLFDDEVVDYEVFRQQARRYGFDEKEYMAALDRVQRWSHEKVDAVMSFYATFAEMIGNLSYSNVKLASVLEERKQAEKELKMHRDHLEELVQDRTSQLEDVNQQLLHDIVNRKRAEVALWESSQMLKLVLGNMPGSVFWKDRNGVYLGCNNSFAEFGGLSSPEEIIGLTDFDMPWKDSEAESYRADDRKVMETGVPKLNYEESQHVAGGRTIWVRTSKIPLRNPEGDIIGVLGAFEDITERKQAEGELGQSRERLVRIVETVPSGILTLAANGQITLANAAAQEILEMEHEEIVGKLYSDPSLWTALTMDGIPMRNEDRPFARVMQTGRAVEDQEYVAELVSGVRKILSINAAPMRNPSGETVGVVESLTDITQIVKLQKTIESQLQLLQQALVPPAPTMADGYRAASLYLPAHPGENIGGDLYEVFKTETGNIGIMIGDVAGKGVEAAALAAAARSTLHSFAYDLSSASAAMYHANAVLESQSTTEGEFVTAFLAIIDPSTGAFSYSRAGHPPAAIKRASGEVEFLAEGDMPLGLFAEQTYRLYENHLNPGDKIILYTDGITEARHGEELFELEGVQHALTTCGKGTSAEVAECLLSEARDWAEGHLQDDIAILVVERLTDEQNEKNEQRLADAI